MLEHAPYVDIQQYIVRQKRIVKFTRVVQILMGDVDGIREVIEQF